MLDAMLDIFEHPENFKIDGKTTFAEALSEDKGKKFDYATEYAAELLQSECCDFKNTRTEKNITSLEQEFKEIPTSAITRNLSRQAINVLSDIEFTNELERQMILQTDKLPQNGKLAGEKTIND